MKKIFFLSVLPLLLGNLFAQNVNQANNLQIEKLNEDVLLLQKSNAFLKNQLNEQKNILFNQTTKTDSIISVLQSTSGEIKKMADDQNSASYSVSALKEQTTNIGLIFSDISRAFNKRRTYAILAIISFVLLFLLSIFYLKKKFSSMNNNLKQQEENLNLKIAQTREYIDREISGIKLLFEKQASKISLVIEKQNSESKKILSKLSEDTKESINKMSFEVDKTMESRILSLKEAFQEQHSKFAAELNDKIIELNNIVEKKIATIQNEVRANQNESRANINEVNEKIKKWNSNSQL